MAFTRVSIDYRGIGQYLRGSEELRAALFAHATVGVAFAKSIAPVGPADDPHRGEFRDSISAHTYTAPGGFIAARITAAPLWVEFGRKRVRRYEGAHVLRKTAAYLNSPKRSA